MAGDDVETLRSRWSTLYTKTLPALAKAKDAGQPKWPVTLDHCFARIILDNTVGESKSQWDHVIKKPALKNMSETQLREAIALGEMIKDGKVDLVELDQKSLQARGKGENKYKATGKHARDTEAHPNAAEGSSPKRVKVEDKKQSVLSFGKKSQQLPSPASSLGDGLRSGSVLKGDMESFPNPNSPEFLRKIQSHPSLTPYRKRLYSTLLSVPAGHHTTYQAMATFLNSSARAIGNGMRNNPFAPDVPCHRVLASDGSIGGFHGSWGEEGKYAREKIDLLKSEGVYFDSRGKVKGPVFRDFEDLSTRSMSAG